MRVAAFSTGQLSTLVVVRDVFYSQLWVKYTRAVQGIICAARTMRISGPSTYYTLSLPWSCPLLSRRAGKVWWVVAKQHTYGDCELKLIYSVKQTAYTASVHVHFSTYTCTWYMYMNYLRRSIFLLLVALQDTYLVTNMISRLGIVIKSV